MKNYVLWQIHHYANSLASEGRLDNIIPFDLLLNEDGTPDLSNLIKFMGNSFPENDEILNLYKHAEVPLAFLAASMQGLLYAITKINQENAGFIRCCPLFTGNYNQIDVAKNIFENKIECYLDVTSALFLSITGILEKVTPFILKLKVPSSVLNYLHQLVAKSINYPGHAGSLSYNKGQLIFFKKDDDSQQNYIQLLNKAIGWLEQNCEIINISESSKNDDVLESRFPSELVDACILAQRDRKIVLTEDPLYLHANNLITKKTLPDYCSSIVLVKLLADKRKITFNEYLEYFYFLTLHRFHYLSISIQDLEKAVFGDGQFRVYTPKKIKKFNFKLTLSEEYGTTFEHAFNLIGTFIYRLVLDLTLDIRLVPQVMDELIIEFPTKEKVSTLAIMLIETCRNTFMQNLYSTVSSFYVIKFSLRYQYLCNYAISLIQKEQN